MAVFSKITIIGVLLAFCSHQQHHASGLQLNRTLSNNLRTANNRTKQTAKTSTGGAAPREQLANKAVPTADDQFNLDGRTKQTAKESTGGSAPRPELANKSVRIDDGQFNMLWLQSREADNSVEQSPMIDDADEFALGKYATTDELEAETIAEASGHSDSNSGWDDSQLTMLARNLNVSCSSHTKTCSRQSTQRRCNSCCDQAPTRCRKLCRSACIPSSLHLGE